MRSTGALVLGLLLCGCPKPDAPEFDPDDRLLQKLKAEQERLSKAGPRPGQAPQPDPLAAVLAAPSKPESLGIPSGVSADFGPVALTLIEVQQSQQVGTDRVSVATTDRFLKVTLEATAQKDLVLELSGAALEREGHTAPLARDAQRAGKGSPLSLPLRAGKPQPVVLFFEAPPEMISKGLKIILTSAESRVELALQ